MLQYLTPAELGVYWIVCWKAPGTLISPSNIFHLFSSCLTPLSFFHPVMTASRIRKLTPPLAHINMLPDSYHCPQTAKCRRQWWIIVDISSHIWRRTRNSFTYIGKLEGSSHSNPLEGQRNEAWCGWMWMVDIKRPFLVPQYVFLLTEPQQTIPWHCIVFLWCFK